MVLALTATVVAVILLVAIVVSLRSRSRSRSRVEESASVPLPVGAEAAIWSILEAVPDPRNHLALTRDLTGEVRITGTPLDPAWRAANPGVDPWTALSEHDDVREHRPLTAA